MPNTVDGGTQVGVEGNKVNSNCPMENATPLQDMHNTEENVPVPVDMDEDSSGTSPSAEEPVLICPEGGDMHEPSIADDESASAGAHEVESASMEVRQGVQQLRTISRLLAFDRRNGLHHTILVDLQGTVCTHDIDGFGICMENPDAILPRQAIRMQWIPKSALLSSRSVLYGEHSRGKEYLSLMVARLEQFGQSIMILWKKGNDMEDEGIPNTMSFGVASAAYESAVKSAGRKLMMDEELESVHSFTANLGYVPESGALCTESQRFDGSAGIAVLRTVWQEFKRVIEETLPAVHVMLYVEHYGDKAELDSFTRTLDQWFDLQKCTQRRHSPTNG
jgi:hypothetical protein